MRSYVYELAIHLKTVMVESKCFKCQGAHHVSICERELKRPYGQAGQGGAITRAPENSASSVTMYSDSNIKGTVLLQTARAVVFRPHDGSNSTNVRLVFDSCSLLFHLI